MSEITIAYCPTMSPFAKTIEETVDGVKTIPASAAAEVLFMLSNGEVDAALIGRVAYKMEISKNTKSMRLREGITLAYKIKSGVNIGQLKEIEVVTYLAEDRVEPIKDLFAKVTHLDSLGECLKYGLEVPVLVDWRDFRDDFGLLIPMGVSGKTPEFRAPVIYYNHDINADMLQKIRHAVAN